MKKRDLVLLIDIFFLVLVGLPMVYSASNVVAEYKYDDAWYYFKRQFLFAIIGLIVMFYLSKIDLLKIKKYTNLIFYLSLALLILVLIPGIGVVRGGARSWIGFGAFSIQPAEFMKLAITLLLAKYLGDNALDLKKLKPFLIILCLIIAIFGLIMLQPDFGTGVVIVLSMILLLYMSGAPLKYFLGLLVMGFIGGVILIISAPYRIERILAFLNPWNDPLGSGFQGIQSLLAIAPSGFFGLGYNQSIQKHFFLPEPQNDFIFAIICEELGLIGALIILLAYTIIFIKSIQIASKVSDNYNKYLALGLGITFFIQVFINISVVIGLIPVTGITLPIISSGGSSLLLSLASLGILLNVSREVDV